jgi:hypothetical protein
MRTHLFFVPFFVLLLNTSANAGTIYFELCDNALASIDVVDHKDASPQYVFGNGRITAENTRVTWFQPRREVTDINGTFFSSIYDSAGSKCRIMASGGLAWSVKNDLDKLISTRDRLDEVSKEENRKGLKEEIANILFETNADAFKFGRESVERKKSGQN